MEKMTIRQLAWIVLLAAFAGSAASARSPHPGQIANKPEEVVQPSLGRAAAQLVNIKLDLTITDQRGSGTPTSKTVTMVLSDRANGRIRTQGDVRMPDGRRVPISLNVDAMPEITRDNRVKMTVVLEYKPQAADGDTEEKATTSISESMSVILEDGKPLVVSQSADPSSDRKVKIEMKATFLK